jgi:hypothetical protein
MKLPSLALFVGCAILASPVARAHHSFAMFDLTQTVEKEGVVKDLQWTNPHVWLTIETMDAGTPEEWGFESGPTNYLLRSGWKRDSLKPGDKVVVTLHPMKDGSHAGSLMAVKLDDGKVLNLGVQGAKPDDQDKPQ